MGPGNGWAQTERPAKSSDRHERTARSCVQARNLTLRGPSAQSRGWSRTTAAILPLHHVIIVPELLSERQGACLALGRAGRVSLYGLLGPCHVHQQAEESQKSCVGLKDFPWVAGIVFT